MGNSTDLELEYKPQTVSVYVRPEDKIIELRRKRKRMNVFNSNEKDKKKLRSEELNIAQRENNRGTFIDWQYVEDNV